MARAGGFIRSAPQRWSLDTPIRHASGYGTVSVGNGVTTVRPSSLMRWFFPAFELRRADVRRIRRRGARTLELELADGVGGGAVYFAPVFSRKDSRETILRALSAAGFPVEEA
jgi:hypothetical protein